MGYCVAPLNNLIVRLTDKENRDREKVTYKNAKQVTQMQESSKTSALCGTISAVLVFFVICAPIVFGVSNIASISAAAVADKPVQQPAMPASMVFRNGRRTLIRPGSAFRNLYKT